MDYLGHSIREVVTDSIDLPETVYEVYKLTGTCPWEEYRISFSSLEEAKAYLDDAYENGYL